MNTTQENLNTKLSAIDKALAAAQARKAAKEGTSSPAADSSPGMKQPKMKLDEATKIAMKAAREAERALRKQQRDAAREEKRSARTSSKPAHMKKVERAASKLPEMNEQLQLLFNEATTNFSAAQITALALHLQHFNRVKATERAVSQKVELGQTVRIVGGDPKFIGMTGTVSLARRIRCFVDVPGFKKPAYCFTSDVEIVAEAQAATGTEG